LCPLTSENASRERHHAISSRWRKRLGPQIALVSKAAIVGGVALPIFLMLGLFESNEVAAIGSIAVVLGGIVSLGSNASTLRQTMAAMCFGFSAAPRDIFGKANLSMSNSQVSMQR
jgi:hypothetical protein